MSLQRHQIPLAVSGGVFAVGALALGYFLFSAFGARSEAREERDESMEAINRLYSAKVFPSRESLEAVKANREQLAVWRENAALIAGRGDRVFGEASPSSFKQRLQGEVARMAALPGIAPNGKIAAEGFLFGFDKYLSGSGTLPDVKDLGKLQRQLDFIAEAVKALAEAGVGEIKLVKRDETPAAEEAAPGKGAKAASSLKYSFQFLASPKALVDSLNAFATCSTFTVIDSFSFTESSDLIVEKFAARDQAAASASSSRRRTRRGAAQAEAEKPAFKVESGEADRIVIDPEIDAPLAVSIEVSVWDFGTAAEAPAAEKPAAEALAAEKPAAEAPAAEKPAAEAPAAEKPADDKPAEAAADKKEDASK